MLVAWLPQCRIAMVISWNFSSLRTGCLGVHHSQSTLCKDGNGAPAKNTTYHVYCMQLVLCRDFFPAGNNNIAIFADCKWSLRMDFRPQWLLVTNIMGCTKLKHSMNDIGVKEFLTSQEMETREWYFSWAWAFFCFFWRSEIYRVGGCLWFEGQSFGCGGIAKRIWIFLAVLQ